jgi:hypothetical protein
MAGGRTRSRKQGRDSDLPAARGSALNPAGHYEVIDGSISPFEIKLVAWVWLVRRD